MEDTISITPTIIRRRDEDTEVVAHVPDEDALLVFRGEEDAEKFRTTTGVYPAEEGYEAVRADARDLARVCILHGFKQVCMPEPWTGSSAWNVDTYAIERPAGRVTLSVRGQPF